MFTRNEIVQKAISLVQAALLAGLPAPTLHAVCLELSVADHETAMGSAMFDQRGSAHDWGAVCRRDLTPEEHQVVANIFPVSANVQKAQLAMAQHAPLPDDAVLWCDSRPSPGGTIHYWTWFCRAEDDAHGAVPFVHTITRTVAEQQTLQDPKLSCYAMAQAMYLARYYTGFQDPAGWYVREGAGWKACPAGQPGCVTGRDADIADYAVAIQRCYAIIQPALVGFDPSTVNLPVSVTTTTTTTGIEDACDPADPEVEAAVCSDRSSPPQPSGQTDPVA